MFKIPEIFLSIKAQRMWQTLRIIFNVKNLKLGPICQKR